MVPIQIMCILTLPKVNAGTKIYSRLHINWKIIFSEPSEVVVCLFASLKSSGSHNLVYNYQILTKIILSKHILGFI